MKTYIAIILTFILVCLIALTGLLYKQSNSQEKTEIIKHEQVNELPKATSPKVTPKNTEESENNEEQDRLIGKVAGSLCYPSSAIPPLDVFLQNVNTNEIISIQTNMNQQEFEFDEVLAGKYIAFAYPQSTAELGGGYTEFVPCGLSVECTDHSFIEFDVDAGETTSEIEICDWYGAEIPAKPEI